MKDLKKGYIVEVKSRDNERMIVTQLSHRSRVKGADGKYTDEWEDVWRLARIKKNGEPNATDLRTCSRFSYRRSELKYVGRTIYAALGE